MRKIPTLFVREYENHKVINVTPEFTNEECKKALFEGIPTLKFDGSCCAIIDGKFYKRYDAKKGKTIPENAIKCQEEPDPISGHMPCWVPVDENNPADKWFMQAYKTYLSENHGYIKNGTYEAIGEHFQGNPYYLGYDILEPHGEVVLEDFKINPNEDYFEQVKNYLTKLNGEGIVFWLDNEPICKIKRTDFGLNWNK